MSEMEGAISRAILLLTQIRDDLGHTRQWRRLRQDIDQAIRELELALVACKKRTVDLQWLIALLARAAWIISTLLGL